MDPAVVDFHPGLTRREFAEGVRSALLRSRVVITRGVDPSRDPRGFWDEVSETLGPCVLLAENPSGEKLGEKWMEIRYDPATPNAFRHSNNAQPLHTDGSYLREAPEIIFFYCLQQASTGGETTFVDGPDVVELLRAERPGLLERLRTTPMTFAKADDRKTRPVIAEDDDGPLFTWNYFTVDRASAVETVSLAEEFHNFLETQVVARGIPRPVRLVPGEAVFFHDARLLHGRNSFIASQPNDRFLWKTGFTLQRLG